jgi:hypothetical protein
MTDEELKKVKAWLTTEPDPAPLDQLYQLTEATKATYISHHTGHGFTNKNEAALTCIHGMESVANHPEVLYSGKTFVVMKAPGPFVLKISNPEEGTAEETFGDYALVYYFGKNSQWAVKCFPLGATHWARDSFNAHPHVNGDLNVCFGEVKAAHNGHLKKNNLDFAYEVAIAVLSNYTHGDAYKNLLQWNSGRCPCGSGYFVKKDKCKCGKEICQMCAIGKTRCKTCAPKCKTCGNFTENYKKCEDCGAEGCGSCLFRKTASHTENGVEVPATYMCGACKRKNELKDCILIEWKWE